MLDEPDRRLGERGLLTFGLHRFCMEGGLKCRVGACRGAFMRPTPTRRRCGQNSAPPLRHACIWFEPPQQGLMQHSSTDGKCRQVTFSDTFRHHPILGWLDSQWLNSLKDLEVVGQTHGRPPAQGAPTPVGPLARAQLERALCLGSQLGPLCTPSAAPPALPLRLERSRRLHRRLGFVDRRCVGARLPGSLQHLICYVPCRHRRFPLVGARGALPCQLDPWELRSRLCHRLPPRRGRRPRGSCDC